MSAAMSPIAPLPSQRISEDINVHCDVRKRRENSIVGRIEGLLMIWVGIAAHTPPYTLESVKERGALAMADLGYVGEVQGDLSGYPPITGISAS